MLFRSLIFLSDVDGVRDGSGVVRTQLTVAEALQLITDGVATGGMQAKIEAAVGGILKGVNEIIIAPGAHAGIVAKLLNGEQIGTRIVRGETK